jgi:hypothetical protein
MSFDAFCKEIWIVYSLSTGDDFFSSTEHVVGVGEVWIRWVGHGVEWADAKREFIEDVYFICQIYKKTGEIQKSVWYFSFTSFPRAFSWGVLSD